MTCDRPVARILNHFDNLTPSMLFARIYLLSYRIWQRLFLLSQEMFIGFWLGVLSRRMLHVVDELRYSQSTTYKNPEYNLSGLFPWENKAVTNYFGECSRLIVVGTGGGREVLALSQMGYEVTGFECNHDLVQCANDLLGKREDIAIVSFLPRDIAPSPNEKTDGIIVGWSTYMLIIGRAHRISFLKNLRPLLEVDAPVLLSFFTRPESAGFHRGRWRIASAIRAILYREPVEQGDDLTPNFVHRFTRNEVQAELREAGFQLVEFHPQGAGPYDSGYAIATRDSRLMS